MVQDGRGTTGSKEGTVERKETNPIFLFSLSFSVSLCVRDREREREMNERGGGGPSSTCGVCW